MSRKERKEQQIPLTQKNIPDETMQPQVQFQMQIQDIQMNLIQTMQVVEFLIKKLKDSGVLNENFDEELKKHLEDKQKELKEELKKQKLQVQEIVPNSQVDNSNKPTSSGNIIIPK